MVYGECLAPRLCGEEMTRLWLRECLWWRCNAKVVELLFKSL